MSSSYFNNKKVDETQDEKVKTELKDYAFWTFARLQEYLLKAVSFFYLFELTENKKGKITDPNWLDNYFASRNEEEPYSSSKNEQSWPLEAFKRV